MTDRATVQSVVRLLGLLALLCVGGLIFLADRGNLSNETSIALVGLASAAAGGIAGLLAKTDSVDVAGLQRIADANAESFLPTLQAKLDDARREGEQEALASVVPATLESFEPVHVQGGFDPASQELAQQLEAASTSSSDVSFDLDDEHDAGEPDDPFGDDSATRPAVE